MDLATCANGEPNVVPDAFKDVTDDGKLYLVDKIFIGYIPGVGKQDLAGVGVTAPVILAISAFAALVSMGGATQASIR